MLATRVWALPLLVLLGCLSSGAWAQQPLTCPVDSQWATNAPMIAFLGVNAACPGAASAISVGTCSQCVCSVAFLFQDVNVTLTPNATDTGSFAILSDFFTTCINSQSSSFTDVEVTVQGLQNCLASNNFQNAINGSANNLQNFCRLTYAPSPPPLGTPVVASPPPFPDAIPPAFESSTEESSGGEESSGAEFNPPPFPPGTILPPPPSVYPPGYPGIPAPPGVYPPPARPPSAAGLTAANLALQGAVALLALLAAAMLF